MRYSQALTLSLITVAATSLTASVAQPQKLIGEVTLTLHNAIWHSSQTGQNKFDLILDFVCDQNRCQPEVWGYAPEFNQADHSGEISLKKLNSQQQATVNLTISPDPWIAGKETATYRINFQQAGNLITGQYQGNIDQQTVTGTVSGKISASLAQPLPNHQPLQPQEYPRLLFRTEQLPALQHKAQTRIGKAIIKELKRTLAQPVAYDGYVPNAGYHAAGQCFLSQLQNDEQAAEKAWQLTENAIARPNPRLFEQSPTVAGIALAYDLCYPKWDSERRQQISLWLAQQAEQLIAGTPDRGWNPTPASNWNARARGAAGLAALAILDDPNLPLDIDPQRLLKIAERNIKRYLQQGIGSRGFGTEGDHYTTEPLVLTVLPFLQAYRIAAGQDMISQSSATWVLPHYLTRGVFNPKAKQLDIPTYGRHHRYAGDSLFAVGLGSVTHRFLPAFTWLSHCYLRRQNRPFHLQSPHEAFYAFVNYPLGVAPQNPSQLLGKVLAGSQKGFYVFRNRWQDENDFVASIYLKPEKIKKTWSFPDAGSFRFWGLGSRWAVAGLSERGRAAENVLLTTDPDPIAQLVWRKTRSDGSGVVSLAAGDWLRSFGVDYSSLSGSPALVAIVDRLKNPNQETTWIMHTAEKVTIQGNEFMMRSHSGAILSGIFIAPEAVELSQETQGKITKLSAQGKGDFFMVMSVQENAMPRWEISGSGLSAQVRLGQQTISFDDNHLIFGD